MRGIRIHRTVSFAAAHRLTRFPADHKCHRLHGHNYLVEITVWGPVADLVVDFAVLDDVVRRWDHTHLNDDPDLRDNPTCELVALVLMQRLAAAIPTGAVVERVRVHESERSWAEVER